MIIADANVWIDHIRRADPVLVELAMQRKLLMHPYTIGELSLGSFAARASILEQMKLLPGAPLARHEEVLQLIESGSFFGTGIGYVDCHLLASLRLLSGAALWTRDKRLRLQAERLGIAVRL